MILVTGATGFVGRSLVPVLVANGHRVRMLTRTQPSQGILPADAEIVVGDLLQPPTLDTALDGIATVIHLGAAVPPRATGSNLFRTNVEGTRNLARAAREHGATAFIHVSSAGVYGDGTSEVPHSEQALPAARREYERSKLESERILMSTLEASNVRKVILRPSGLYGPGRPATVAFYRAVQNKTVWIHSAARVIVHPTHVDDVVQAIGLVLDRPDINGETFNVGGARALAYAELIELVACVLGLRVRQVVPLRRTCRAGVRIASIAARVCGIEPPATVARLASPVVNRAVDISKARRQLGFEPIELEAGVRATVHWAKREGLLDSR